MADLWSDYTDGMISDIDDELGTKYKMSVRRFLSDPGKYAKQEGISITMGNMQEDVDGIIDEQLKDYAAEQKSLMDDAAKADSITTQITQTLNLKAKQNKLPLIRPVMVERDETHDEVVYINSVESGTLMLIDKLTDNADFVADFTYPYKNYKIGNWLFCGEKNYTLRVYLQPSEVLYIENGKNEIDALFNNAKAALG